MPCTQGIILHVYGRNLLLAVLDFPMNILPQMKLFEDNDFDFLGDLERLQSVLSVIDDEKLIQKLYKIRGKGRNDWPCEAMWNSFIASFLFEHETAKSLLRELCCPIRKLLLEFYEESVRVPG